MGVEAKRWSKTSHGRETKEMKQDQPWKRNQRDEARSAMGVKPKR
jgi:hypothetical protein